MKQLEKKWAESQDEFFIKSVWTQLRVDIESQWFQEDINEISSLKTALMRKTKRQVWRQATGSSGLTISTTWPKSPISWKKAFKS